MSLLNESVPFLQFIFHSHFASVPCQFYLPMPCKCPAASLLLLNSSLLTTAAPSRACEVRQLLRAADCINQLGRSPPALLQRMKSPILAASAISLGFILIFTCSCCSHVCTSVENVHNPPRSFIWFVIHSFAENSYPALPLRNFLKGCDRFRFLNRVQ